MRRKGESIAGCGACSNKENAGFGTPLWERLECRHIAERSGIEAYEQDSFH